MLIQCSHRGCYSSNEHLLDLEKNEVFCTECGEAIDLPPTTKKILKTMGQVRRTPRSGVQAKCTACGHTGKPLLKNLSGSVTIAVCRECDKQVNMHPSFILAMKEMGTEYTTKAEEEESPSGRI